MEADLTFCFSSSYRLTDTIYCYQRYIEQRKKNILFYAKTYTTV